MRREEFRQSAPESRPEEHQAVLWYTYRYDRSSNDFRISQLFEMSAVRNRQRDKSTVFDEYEAHARTRIAG